jgi:hypothetical protein
MTMVMATPMEYFVTIRPNYAVHLGMETKFAKELPILPEKMIFRL